MDMRMMADEQCSVIALPPYLNTAQLISCQIIWDTSPYGVLCLQTEEKAGGKVMELLHTDFVRIPILLQISLKVLIIVKSCNNLPPYHVPGLQGTKAQQIAAMRCKKRLQS